MVSGKLPREFFDEEGKFKIVAKIHPWWIDEEVVAHLKKKYIVKRDEDRAILLIIKK